MSFQPKSEIINISHWADVVTIIVRKYLYDIIGSTPHAVTAAHEGQTVYTGIDKDDETIELQDGAIIYVDPPKDEIDRLWTIETSIAWIRLRIDDEFNSQMKWAARTTNADEYLIKLLKDVVSKVTNVEISDSDKLSQEALDAIYQDIDVVESLIIEQCTKLIAPNPWYVWSLKTRHEFIAFEANYDYRIKAFEELYELVEAKDVDDMMSKVKNAVDKSTK